MTACLTEPRLLTDTALTDLGAHQATFGPLPPPSAHLVDQLAQAGLTGRGGAAFPVHRKWAAVAAGRRRAVVVANAAEGEPASDKDKLLLWTSPHLVLDGLQLAAHAVGASSAYLYLHRHPTLVGRVGTALAARRGIDRYPVEVVEAPPRFLAGEESALVSRINGRLAQPTFTPPRVFEKGVRGAPTLVQNAETLAHVALIARYGPAWFRESGTEDEPGSMLCTLHRPGEPASVVETSLGTPLQDLLPLDASDSQPTQAVLVGGYHGAWLAADVARGCRLSRADLRAHGAAPGAGVLAALPADRCGLVESARVVAYLAGESAGQCGPCLNGLPRIAAALARLARPVPAATVLDDIHRWSGLLPGRGACHHPDGTVRFVRSTLTVFAAELRRHAAGRCSATNPAPFLPVPPPPRDRRDWR